MEEAIVQSSSLSSAFTLLKKSNLMIFPSGENGRRIVGTSVRTTTVFVVDYSLVDSWAKKIAELRVNVCASANGTGN
jgi:hypothetical protein